MRILFGATPAFGHLLPLIPLLRAAQADGHDVAVLTSVGMRHVVTEQVGDVPVLAAGPMPDAIFAEVRRRSGVDPLFDARPETVAEIFAGARVDLSGDEALRSSTDWAPDVLVAEACDYVARFVAAALERPLFVHGFGPALPAVITTAMDEVAAVRYAERGLRPQSPVAYIDPAPDALQDPEWVSDLPRLQVRPEPHRGAATSWVRPVFQDTDGRHSVLVTLGTVFSDVALLEQITGSLDSDANVVATTGFGAATPMPADQPGVRYVPFVPLDELLNGQDVVVSVGGAGTVLASLARGLPLVLLPRGADQPLNAARAAAAGAAIVVDSAEAVEAAVQEVLTDPSYLRAARRIAAEVADMPPASAVLAAIEAAHRDIARV